MNDLKTTAITLREIGDLNPLDLAKAISEEKLTAFPPQQQAIVTIAGVECQIQYSLDVLSELKKARHVSVSSKNGTLTREILDQIKQEFYSNQNAQEFTSPFGVIHFIALV